MLVFSSFKDKPVALFGLGKSGLAAACSLLEGGADLVCWDDNPESVEKAVAYGLTVRDLRKEDWKRFTALVLSPGVSLTHPQPHWTVSYARCAGIEIIGDIELFVRERRKKIPDAPFFAITGTNGKSTTTALIAHILEKSGRRVEMGGNIGRAVATFDSFGSDCHYVIECSSFQIELSPSLDASVGILLNITPDHLDRHGSMDHYVSIKEQLVSLAHYAVVGADDSYCSDILYRLKQKNQSLACISSSSSLEEGYYAEGETLFMAQKGENLPLISLGNVPMLRGRHNKQNALASIAACLKAGLSIKDIESSLNSFSGLAHRMQIIDRKGHVLFVNDSKATNADAASAALATFEKIYWILGGLPKEGGIESLRPFFPQIVRAYLIGEAASSFATTLQNSVAYEISETLSVAVRRAARDAALDQSAEAVVLFSPACASFDQFKNFEVRGDAFCVFVKELGDFPYLSQET